MTRLFFYKLTQNRSKENPFNRIVPAKKYPFPSV